jgi:hypothetical protein
MHLYAPELLAAARLTPPPAPAPAAKTNFPLREYEAEVAEFEAYMMHT